MKGRAAGSFDNLEDARRPDCGSQSQLAQIAQLAGLAIVPAGALGVDEAAGATPFDPAGDAPSEAGVDPADPEGAAACVAAGVESPPVAAGTVTGVTMIPVTLPVIACFCFLPVVPRAFRVARFLTTAVAFVWTVLLVLLRGESPKSASVLGS